MLGRSSCRLPSLLLSRRQLTFTSPDSGEESRKVYGQLRVRLRSSEEAVAFAKSLGPKERVFLNEALRLSAPPAPLDEQPDTDTAPMTKVQRKSLFLVNSLPFIGFGFLDNFIMIVAGEAIDARLGVALGFSTMAAAGIGNIISDVAGVGLAHQVESLVARLGITAPALTAEQWDSSETRRISNLGKVIGLTFGCIVGMFPLVFYPGKKTEKDSESEESQEK